MLVPEKGTSGNQMIGTAMLAPGFSSTLPGNEWERTLGTSMRCNVSHERHHFVVKIVLQTFLDEVAVFEFPFLFLLLFAGFYICCIYFRKVCRA